MVRNRNRDAEDFGTLPCNPYAAEGGGGGGHTGTSAQIPALRGGFWAGHFRALCPLAVWVGVCYAAHAHGVIYI